MKKIIELIIIGFVFAVSNVYFIKAEDESVNLNNIDTGIYAITSVQNICHDINKNSFRAGNIYKNNYYAVIGNVESISSNGKTMYLNTQEGISFKCLLNSKAKKSIVQYSSDDKIVVFGKISKINEKTVEMNISQVNAFVGDSGKYIEGIACAERLHKKDELLPESFEKITYTSLNTWEKSIETVDFGDDYSVDGIKYSLGSDEYLTVYYFDYSTVKKVSEIMKNDGEEWFPLNAKRKVKNFITGNVIEGRLVYKVSNVKINKISYELYDGKRESSVDPKNAYVFYLQKGAGLITITYETKGTYKHINDAMLLIATLLVN